MKAVLVLHFMAFSIMGIMAQANDITLTLLARTGDSEQLKLEFSNHVVVTVSSSSSGEKGSQKDASELLLRFDRPIGRVATTSINPWIGPVLADFRYGYDSLLFVFRSDIVWNVEQGSGFIVVTVAQEAVSVAPVDRVTSRSSQEETLDYLTAVSALDAGDFNTAERLIARYTSSASGNQWRELDARSKLVRGDWRAALRQLRRIEIGADLNSTDSGLAQMIEREEGDTVDLSLGWRDVSNAYAQQTYRIDGRSLLGGEARIGAWIEHRRVDAPATRQGLQPVGPVEMDKSYLGAWVDWGLKVHSARATVYQNQHNSGIGVDYVHGAGMDGKLTLAVAASRPYLDYVEGVIGNATRDVMSAGYETRQGRLFVQSELARYWYDLSTLDNVADSYGARVGLNYGVWENDPRLTVRYAFDYENVSSVKTLRDVNDVVFSPLPLSDRATHALGMEWNDQVSKSVRYTLATGYSYDPNTLSAPYFLVRGDFQMTSRFSSSLFAGRTVAVESGSDQSVTSFGAQLKVLF